MTPRLLQSLGIHSPTLSWPKFYLGRPAPVCRLAIGLGARRVQPRLFLEAWCFTTLRRDSVTTLDSHNICQRSHPLYRAQHVFERELEKNVNENISPSTTGSREKTEYSSQPNLPPFSPPSNMFDDFNAMGSHFQHVESNNDMPLRCIRFALIKKERQRAPPH